MQIDAHQHFWNFDPVRDAWITEEMRAIRTDFTPYDLLRELKDNGVDGSVVVQADTAESETAFLVDIADRHDFVKGVVGWIDLCGDYAAERLRFYRKTAPKVKGFRHVVQAEPDDAFLLREDFCRGVALLHDYGYTYDILIYPRQLPAAIRFVERFPEQKFVIDHIAKPDIKNGTLQPWTDQMKTIASFPNVWCKVSGMITEANWTGWTEADLKPYLEVVFEAFGAGRLMFGSDWPVCLVAGTYGKVKAVITNYMQEMTAADRAAVMGDNATAFYNL